MKKKLIANDLLQSLQEASSMEQGQRTPVGAAARLLEILSKDAQIADDLAS